MGNYMELPTMMHPNQPDPRSDSSTPVDLTASAPNLRDLTSPKTVAELLTLAQDPKAHATLDSYDKLFIQAREIYVFDDAGVVVCLRGADDLVRINNNHDPESFAPTVKELRAMRPETDLTVENDFSIRAHGKEGILVSAGTFLFVIDESGKEQLLTLTRTADAEIAPGEIQGPSGRCDRPIGMSCFVELAEETLIVAETMGRSVLLGIRGTPYLSDEDTVAIIQNARSNALRALEAQLAKAANTSALEAGTILERLMLLRDAQDVVMVDATPDSRYQEKIRTTLDGVTIESLEGMFGRYDYEANTFEARMVRTLDLRQHPGLVIKGLYDGDGFGRTVSLRDPTGPWPEDKLTSTLARFLLRHNSDPAE
jgi:hypothetical protein